MPVLCTRCLYLKLWPRRAVLNHAVTLCLSLPTCLSAFAHHPCLPTICPPPAAIMNSLKTYDSLGKTYHLAGPDVMTVAEQVGGRRGGLAAGKWSGQGLLPQAGPVPQPRCARLALRPTRCSPLAFPSRPVRPLPPQVDFTFQTIREKNTSVTMPSQLALPMAAMWDRLAAGSPFRGPVMFSTDFINEMKVGVALRLAGRPLCGGAALVRQVRPHHRHSPPLPPLLPLKQGDYVLPSGALGFEHLDVVPHKVGTAGWLLAAVRAVASLCRPSAWRACQVLAVGGGSRAGEETLSHLVLPS